jgi:hypothetical protein
VAIRRHRAATTIAAALAVLAAAGAALVVRSQERRADPVPSAASHPAAAPAGQAGPAGRWVAVENRRPGTAGWRITRLGPPEAIQGWTDQVSAAAGERVRLYVSTTARRFQVEAYRMGWYGGHGARLVWRSQPLVGRRQPPPTLTPETNMVATHWPSWAPTPSTATSGWSDPRPGRTANRSTTSPGRSGMIRPGRPTPPR